ncbi:hypothetical protein NQ318_003154 [Aromia moschata]|uniref:Uncharacterized protein n=1 Tax=Aromia moschata TaxID=1265417 RepID=A0AAV8YVC8_9CUCU|nr:hypothetical protein NQ318_003154 [Aromia moschata]
MAFNTKSKIHKLQLITKYSNIFIMKVIKIVMVLEDIITLYVEEVASYNTKSAYYILHFFYDFVGLGCYIFTGNAQEIYFNLIIQQRSFVGGLLHFNLGVRFHGNFLFKNLFLFSDIMLQQIYIYRCMDEIILLPNTIVKIRYMGLFLNYHNVKTVVYLLV